MTSEALLAGSLTTRTRTTSNACSPSLSASTGWAPATMTCSSTGAPRSPLRSHGCANLGPRRDHGCAAMRAAQTPAGKSCGATSSRSAWSAPSASTRRCPPRSACCRCVGVWARVWGGGSFAVGPTRKLGHVLSLSVCAHVRCRSWRSTSTSTTCRRPTRSTLVRTKLGEGRAQPRDASTA